MYWRHVVASSVSAEGEQGDRALLATAGIRTERPGSDRYQQNHMALIFQQGLSFSGFERNKVFIGGKGQRFVDLSDISGADSEGDCRASVVADFDDDGDPDLFVNAIQREMHMLYRNDAGAGGDRGFVKVRLRASTGHADAIGAIVKAEHEGTTTAQVLACGSGFEAQNAPELIFGVGAARESRLTVRWPGRALEDFGLVARDGRYLLIEGTGKPATYAARTFRFGAPPAPGLRLGVGDEIGSLALRTTAGEARDLTVSGEADRPLLLNFWATTCTSCLLELPALAKLHAAGKYRVVAVSVDPDGAAERVRAVWERFAPPFETYLITERAATQLFDLDRLSIPLSIIVDSQGRVTRAVTGRLREGEL